jgi:hypothetical protein
MTTFPTDRSGEIRPKLAGEYDALADLFLGADDAPLACAKHAAHPSLRLVQDAPDTRPHQAPDAHVEAMLLGSLPIYASAWVAQFVRAETERLGSPVALVRTLAGEGSVDLFGAPTRDDQIARAATFSDAMRDAASIAERIVIRTGETSELELASHSRVASIALLTGIDEPALIAAYRVLKMLAPRWETRATPPVIRIAAMGANEEQGRRAFEKIARAARVFLETPLEYAGNVERIEPTSSVSLFRGPTTIDTDDVIDTLRAPRTPEQPARAPETHAPHSAPESPALHQPAEPDAAIVEPADSDRATPTVDSLASRIEGLARVPISIPRCEGVELAADASGRLHILARDDDATSPTSTLLAAQAWASVNRDVLGAACATLLGSSVDASRPAILHLFTDQPKRVRSLLDADIRVHFLGHVEIDGARAWCIAELN